MPTANNNNNSPLHITELDYDSILENLRDWLRTQDTFRDYDFEGSGLSVLLKTLAYNTHYNAFYVNMAANEGFIQTAYLPRNIYAHAKTLNYLPGSRTASQATIQLSITPPPLYIGSSFTLPQYTPFISEAVDGVNYSFVLLEAATASRSSSFGDSEPFLFPELIIYQGEPVVIRYTVDAMSNPKLRYEIPSSNVDMSTLVVQTQVSAANTLATTWERSSDITEVDSESYAYFVERGSNGNYTVYFGDGNIGVRPSNGNILLLSYLVTHGEAANKATNFTLLPVVANVSSSALLTLTSASGGRAEESVESIKVSAPIYYAAQNRAVTKSDFEVIIKKDFPQVGSVSVWGGEENNPPIYGKIFIALAPAEGLVISRAEKDEIIRKLVDDRVTLSLHPEIVDADFIYIRVKTSVEYDKSRTTVTKGEIVSRIRDAIVDYNEDNLSLFDSKFVKSKLSTAIDAVNPAIIGNDTKISLEKRFTPTLGRSGTYTLNFNTELKRGSILEKLGSTSFQVYDSEGIERTAFFEEKPLSYTGIDDIVVTNPGFGYVEPPTVVITGDGEGANAVAKVVNGRIQSIEVVDKGESYTTAIVTLEAVNGGSSATAKPIIAARFGVLRTYYYNDLKQKVIINENAGTIDYSIGQIIVSAFNPTNYDEYIAIWLITEDPIIESARGNILLIDTSDDASISIDLTETR